LFVRYARDIQLDITIRGEFPMRIFQFARLAFSAGLMALMPVAANAADVTVFAAASLTDVLSDIGKSYQHDTGKTVTFSFASSSVLAKQIEASSGVDMFVSADTDWMDYLDTRGLVAHNTRKDLLGNHLVLIAPAGSSVSLAIAPHFDLLGALHGERLSIADPDTVPAGKYAKTALSVLGVWSGVAGRTVNAENVRVALTYVARGEAPLGIVYSTDAQTEPKVRIVGVFPENTHKLIVYPVALTKDAKPAAQAFFDYLGGTEARATFEKAGFVILGGGP
jgi:molybdate transport system substrate-binding protein